MIISWCTKATRVFSSFRSLRGVPPQHAGVSWLNRVNRAPAHLSSKRAPHPDLRIIELRPAGPHTPNPLLDTGPGELNHQPAARGVTEVHLAPDQFHPLFDQSEPQANSSARR